MENLVIENHKKYCDRISLFQQLGYDIPKERNFIIENVQPIEGKILEIGTGNGYFSVALVEKGYSFTTLDMVEEDQNIAKMNIQYLGLQDQVDFVVADAQQLPFSDNSYDISFAINLIHHLANPLKVIDEILRVTSSKGKVILSDFSKEGFAVMEEMHLSEGRNHDSGYCTLNEIAEYAEGKGMNIDRVDSKFQKMLIVYKRSN